MTLLDFITGLHPASQLVAVVGVVVVAHHVLALVRDVAGKASAAALYVVAHWREEQQVRRLERKGRKRAALVVAGLLLLGSLIRSDWGPFLLERVLDDGVADDVEWCGDGEDGVG